MATTNNCVRSFLTCTKRIASSTQASAYTKPHQITTIRTLRTKPQRPRHNISPKDLEQELSAIRLPRAVQATYLEPLKRQPTHNGIKTCNLQLRSYSVRNLETFTDFALRAAYYLNLSASGPVPLPKITERWTVPRASFIYKKSQENFERITRRRVVQILDGDAETVGVWLAVLRKWQYFGVGMKADVWESGGLDVAEDMDKEAERIAERIGERLDLVGGTRERMADERMVGREFEGLPFKAQWGALAPMTAAAAVPTADKRIEAHRMGLADEPAK